MTPEEEEEMLAAASIGPERDASRSDAQDARSLLSVVLCSRGRPASLKRCLDSLRALDDHNHEVIIVDNHPTPMIVTSGGRVRVVHERRSGLDFARNRGVTEAEGEIVVFIDDDCEVEPSWLKAIRASFRDMPVACVTGRVVAASTDRPAERMFERLMSFDKGPNPRRVRVAAGVGVSITDVGRVGTGCNMAFRKEIFDRIGGFDEALDMGTLVAGGGDLDMFARILSAGEEVAYEPTAIVYHHHRDTPTKLALQLFGYGVAIGALTLKFAMGRQRRLRTALASQRVWLGWIFSRFQRLPKGRRFLGMPFVLLAVLGDLCGPGAYGLSLLCTRKLHLDRRSPAREGSAERP